MVTFQATRNKQKHEKVEEKHVISNLLPDFRFSNRTIYLDN